MAYGILDQAEADKHCSSAPQTFLSHMAHGDFVIPGSACYDHRIFTHIIIDVADFHLSRIRYPPLAFRDLGSGSNIAALANTHRTTGKYVMTMPRT